MNKLLDRLESVAEVGQGRWIAKCPAHDDRSPSFSIREVDDRILAHCFAGCDIGDVLAAIGLELKDLYLEPLGHHLPARAGRNHSHAARDALRAISREALLVCVAADNLAQGVNLNDEDRGRLSLAANRIRSAQEVVG